MPAVNPVDAVPYAAPDPEPEPEPQDAAPEPAEQPFPEHTMTRRELRALEARQAAELAAAEKPVPTLPEFAADGSLTGAAAAVFIETDFDDDNAADDNAAGDNAADDNAADDSAADDSAADDRPTPVQPTTVQPTTVLPTTTQPKRPPSSRRSTSLQRRFRLWSNPTIAVGSNEEAAADDAAAVDEVPFVAPALSPFDALFQVPPAAPTVAPAGLAPAPLRAADQRCRSR